MKDELLTNTIIQLTILFLCVRIPTDYMVLGDFAIAGMMRTRED